MSNAPSPLSGQSAIAPTLLDFYQGQFRPSIAQLKASRRRQYDQAVRVAIELGGDDLRMNGLHQLFFAELAINLRKLDPSGRSVDLMIACLNRIAKDWNPAAAPGVRLANRKFRRPVDTAPKGSLREYVEKIYVPQNLIGCNHATIVNIQKAVASLFEHYGSEIKLSQLTDALVADHFAWLVLRGIRPITINNGYRATLFCVWRHAYRNGSVNSEPSVKKLREYHDEPDAWTAEEFSSIVKAAERFDCDRDYAGVPRNRLWKALLIVAWYTGLRRSPLLAIHIADLDFANRTLLVPASRMKNGRGKTFRLGQDAIAAIQDILSPPRRLLFPVDCSIETLGRHFDAIVELAGLPKSVRKVCNVFHKVRRSTATAVALAAGEATAAALLGHSSAIITQRYIDPSKMPGNDASAILPSLNLG